MDQQDERLIEEVRKYRHLYDSNSPHYKDSTYSNNAWKEISQNVGLDSAECVRRWKNQRDKFVRQRKVMMTKQSGKSARIPAFHIFMSWLEPFINHRRTTTNFPSEDIKDLRKVTSEANKTEVLHQTRTDEQIHILLSTVAELQQRVLSLENGSKQTTHSSQDTDQSSDLNSDPPSPSWTLESSYASQPDPVPPGPTTSAASSVPPLHHVPTASPSAHLPAASSSSCLPSTSPAATYLSPRLRTASPSACLPMTSPAPSVRPATQRVPARQGKRRHTDEVDMQPHLEQLVESRQMLQRSLVQDDCSSFSMFMADMLRKVPVDFREGVSRTIINNMYEEIDRARAAAQAQD